MCGEEQAGACVAGTNCFRYTYEDGKVLDTGAGE